MAEHDGVLGGKRWLMIEQAKWVLPVPERPNSSRPCPPLILPKLRAKVWHDRCASRLNSLTLKLAKVLLRRPGGKGGV